MLRGDFHAMTARCRAQVSRTERLLTMRTDEELLAEIESDADIDPERLITDPERVKIAAAQIRIKIVEGVK